MRRIYTLIQHNSRLEAIIKSEWVLFFGNGRHLGILVASSHPGCVLVVSRRSGGVLVASWLHPGVLTASRHPGCVLACSRHPGGVLASFWQAPGVLAASRHHGGVLGVSWHAPDVLEVSRQLGSLMAGIFLYWPHSSEFKFSNGKSKEIFRF